MLNLEKALVSLEKHYGITLTIHDHTGFMHTKLIPVPRNRLRHRHPFCETGRLTRRGYDRGCLRDCMVETNRKADETGEPFLHECWKGGAEIVFPLISSGVHLATIFAGVFASSKPSRSKDRSIFLPILDKKLYAELVDVIGLAVEGIKSILDSRDLKPEYPGRKGMIHRYLKLNCHKDINLNSLAAELNLTPSRTSHLVKELFNKSYSNLLQEIRLEKAHHLLRIGTYSIEGAALMCGFNSASYFHRVFKRTYGKPPAEFYGKDKR